jgi:ppGpp synthetase/RelA/SpoT-type nucleotidyltranferase
VNFEDYERRHQAAYAEFAAVVRDIFLKAIAATDGVSPPQSIQCRAKEAARLKPKLQDRGLLDSQLIETEIKDLAGIRLIFYTNTDVDRFLNSQLISDNFDVDWEETRIHHPVGEDTRQRYQAIHYTVRLNRARLDLAEYAKFSGMRCEIQIQTILNHAWAETSHEILYKPQVGKGFGSKALEDIEKRMARIMDEYLLPAGYEFQKVQHDFQRLMQGKALFDRGVIETLGSSANNNVRHEVVSTIKEYVLPHYDDIEGIYPELRAALLKAFDDSRDVETQSIITPFGNIEGKTPQDITAAVVEILDNLRYVDIEGTFLALARLFQRETDGRQREAILKAVRELARYNLQIWERAGPAVQVILTGVIERLDPAERANLSPLLLVAWEEFLNSELRGTSFATDAFAISTGAVPASEDLSEIRSKAITGLLEIFDHVPTEAEKHSVLHSLWAATRLPTQGRYSNELRGLVVADSKRIVEQLTGRIAALSFELSQHLERHLFFLYWRSREIAEAPEDRFGCGELAGQLAAAILSFRNAVNANGEFVRYKTLVGFESVFSFHWEDDSLDHKKAEDHRRACVSQYVNEISEENEEEWHRIIERCAATKSNDLAMFPVFGDFLGALARAKPAIAERILERANDDVLNFLAAFLNGFFESGDREIYERNIERSLARGTHLSGIARHWRLCKPDHPAFIDRVLGQAIAAGDDRAVVECVALTVASQGSEAQPALESFFAPALGYLTGRNNAGWLHEAWFLREMEAFFAELPAPMVELVLTNLEVVPKIDAHVERILACIAASHSEMVWAYFGRRLDHKQGENQKGDYEAVPYGLHGLDKKLSRNPASAVAIVRSWYRPDDILFEFGGAQLLSAVFPAFPPAFAQILSEMAAHGSDDDIGFVLTVLRKYQGQPATHDVVKELVVRLPADDPRLMKVEISLQMTGVVSGEFGFVEAYTAKKGAIASWLDDERPRVREFAEQYLKKLDRMAAAEQRRAEQRRELRRREFES